MSVWDKPEARPPSAWPYEGESVEAVISRVEFVEGKYGPVCMLELNHDGWKRYAPKTLWRVLFRLRPELGDRVRIYRIARDEWQVDRVQGAASPATEAISHAEGPVW